MPTPLKSPSDITSPIPSFLFLILLLLLSISLSVSAYPFRDLSVAAGLSPARGRDTKYGGATVADLNGDGWPDLLLGHHSSSPFQLYFNDHGKFRLSSFTRRDDTHALTPFYASSGGAMTFIHSRGGSRGTHMRSVEVFRVVRGSKEQEDWWKRGKIKKNMKKIKDGERTVVDVTGNSPDIVKSRRRNRSAIVLVMRVRRRIVISSPTHRSSSGRSYSSRISSGNSNNRKPYRSYSRSSSSSISSHTNTSNSSSSKISSSSSSSSTSNIGLPDVLLLARPDNLGNQHRAFTIGRNEELLSRPLRPATLRNSASYYGGVVDIDGDGVMEILLMGTLSIWKLIGDYHYKDITAQVLPASARENYFGVMSYAELDYDNDGHFDLFVVRSNSGVNWWIKRQPLHDNLLRNVNGQYYTDVTETAGIPIMMPRMGSGNGGEKMMPTDSHGVTTGDFDNDGFVDILICRYASNSPAYVLLHNQGDGTFKRVSAGFARAGDSLGDAATAIDYDQDGRLDIVLSEGDWGRLNRPLSGLGYFRVMRNLWVTGNGYLLVRVRNAPRRTATSLHALVTVTLNGGSGSMYRRVGSPGTTVSNSYVELVHFGVGKIGGVVKMVTVKWTDGSVQRKMNVRVNSTVEFGV